MKTSTKITVRYNETDQMGVVHHSVYPIWFEAARVDFIKNSGVPFSQIEKDGLFFPVIEIGCSYYISAKFEDELIIEAEIVKLSFAKAKFIYKVYNTSSNILLAEGFSVHGFISKTDYKPVNVKKYFPLVYQKLSQSLEPVLLKN